MRELKEPHRKNETLFRISCTSVSYGLQIAEKSQRLQYPENPAGAECVILGIISKAHCYITNDDVHRDFRILTIDEELSRTSDKYEFCLYSHANLTRTIRKSLQLSSIEALDDIHLNL